jgi:hypothetical protein
MIAAKDTDALDKKVFEEGLVKRLFVCNKGGRGISATTPVMTIQEFREIFKEVVPK